MHKILTAALLAAALVGPSLASAGNGTGVVTTTTTFAETSETTLFAGFAITLGRGEGVEGILGVAHGRIDLDGDVRGAKATAHFDILDGFSLDKLKLTGLVGNSATQAELGGGYSFSSAAPFAVIGANGEYFAAGTDIYFDGGGAESYLSIHSIGEISLDSTTTTMMGPGGTDGEFSPIDFTPIDSTPIDSPGEQ
ncbi:MAG: hypothetical protein AAF727_03395 [Pseudomonadota bacterium]